MLFYNSILSLNKMNKHWKKQNKTKQKQVGQ